MSQTLPVVFLACKVFEGILESKEESNNVFLDYGLHSIPKQLTKAVQEQLDALPEPSLIVLGYGLCGNGLNNIKAGKHTLVIPKADDCVAMFMGSRKRYMDQFAENPGTYYPTKGWFEVGSDPLSEYKKLIPKYGEETADWLMETQYQHYKKLVFVAHTEDDLKTYRPRALEVAAYCERFGMVYEEYQGSDEFIQKIDNLFDFQDKISEEFVVVQSDGILKQEMFL
ncbi:MAG: DUF1638 domain-containing protein [Chloroflexi bacterium]|nr:DUF1638 domain-containing protein [Chloroflexota bacterium]